MRRQQHRSAVHRRVLIAAVERRHCFPPECLRRSALPRHFTAAVLQCRAYRRRRRSGLWRQRPSAFSPRLRSMLLSPSRAAVAAARTAARLLPTVGRILCHGADTRRVALQF